MHRIEPYTRGEVLGADPWAATEPLIQAIAARAREEWGGVHYAYDLPVSSPFGYRIDPVTGEPGKFHTGIDIALPLGTPILAVFAGTIGTICQDGIGRGEVNGNAIELRTGPRLSFWYLHLSAVNVSPGQAVQWAQPLGLTGSTGRSTGPHLHFQAYLDGRVFDPRLLYPGGLFG